MSEAKAQTLANHARYVPNYHFLTAGILIVNGVWTLVQCFRAPGAGSVISLLVAIALMFLFYYAREFALRVQDRVICLEEQLRLARLLPSDLQPRIGEFTATQLIALRFASDAELPALARRVLQEGLNSRAQIKALIREWRPDNLRA
jgi:hypothetical protein